MCLIQIWIGLLAHLRCSSSPTCILIVFGRFFNILFFKQGQIVVALFYMCASFIFHRIYVISRERIYVILCFQARTNLWFNVFDSRQNLWYVTFSYVAEYVSFYFAMKEKSWLNTLDTADLVLFNFSLYEAKFVLFDSSRQGRITSLFIMSHQHMNEYLTE